MNEKQSRIKAWQVQIDQGLDRLTTHQAFLKTVSVALNANVYRKRLSRKLLEKALQSLEIPIRSDQERMLSLIQELQDKIDDIEAKSSVASVREVQSVTPSRKPKFAKVQPIDSAGARHAGS